MKQKSLVTPLAVALLLAACGDDLAARYAGGCNVAGQAMVKNLFRSSKVDQSRKGEVREAVTKMCACNAERISASKEISQADKEAFFREGQNAKALSSKSGAEIRRIRDNCAREFVKTVVSLRKKRVGPKK